MRLQKWGGLLTNASPYSVPAGAAVSQVNLTCLTAGQLTVRDGMRAVQFGGQPAPDNCVDLASYQFGNQVSVLAFDASGHLSVLTAPGYGPALGSPFAPDLPYDPGQIHVGYDYRYNEGGDIVPAPPTRCLTGVYGGYVATTVWTSCVLGGLPSSSVYGCPGGVSGITGGSPAQVYDCNDVVLCACQQVTVP